jgi:hypothetical protein
MHMLVYARQLIRVLCRSATMDQLSRMMNSAGGAGGGDVRTLTANVFPGGTWQQPRSAFGWNVVSTLDVLRTVCCLRCSVALYGQLHIAAGAQLATAVSRLRAPADARPAIARHGRRGRQR